MSSCDDLFQERQRLLLGGRKPKPNWRGSPSCGCQMTSQTMSSFVVQG